MPIGKFDRYADVIAFKVAPLIAYRGVDHILIDLCPFLSTSSLKVRTRLQMIPNGFELECIVPTVEPCAKQVLASTMVRRLGSFRHEKHMVSAENQILVQFQHPWLGRCIGTVQKLILALWDALALHEG